MWTICYSNYLDTFLSKTNLHNFKNEIVLHGNPESDKHVIFPRYFYKKYGDQNLVFMEDSLFKPQKLNSIEFTGALKDEQKGIVSVPIHRMNNNLYGGIIKARPGAGKTIMSIYLACYFKYKTLIIVDKGILEDQWKESILQFTNLTEDDIGIIKQKQFIVDKPIIIASAKTLINRAETAKDFYPKLRDAGINLVFFDECHKTSAAPKFSRASILLNTRNIYGLSATPFHQGLQDLLMTSCIGDVVVETTQYDITPVINIIAYDSELSNKSYQYKNGKQVPYTQYVKSANEFVKQRSRYNSLICESPIYLDLLYKINKGAKEKNHKTINIVITHHQVETICKYFNEHNLENRPFHAKQKYIDKENDQTLVVTYKYAGDGFDHESLSCCVIATPLTGQKSLIQVIGRLLRECQGKTKAYVYILVDVGFGDMFQNDIDTIEKKVKNEFNCEVNIINYGG